MFLAVGYALHDQYGIHFSTNCFICNFCHYLEPVWHFKQLYLTCRYLPPDCTFHSWPACLYTIQSRTVRSQPYYLYTRFISTTCAGALSITIATSLFAIPILCHSFTNACSHCRKSSLLDCIIDNLDSLFNGTSDVQVLTFGCAMGCNSSATYLAPSGQSCAPNIEISFILPHNMFSITDGSRQSMEKVTTFLPILKRIHGRWLMMHFVLQIHHTLHRFTHSCEADC